VTSPPRRRVRDSLVQMTEIVLPEDTNPRGTIFGGRVLALIDKCAAVVGLRHARSEVLTVSLDSVEFHSPVRLGDILLLEGRINAAFRSSMEIEVLVRSEDPTSGKRMLATEPTGTPTRLTPAPTARPPARAKWISYGTFRSQRCSCWPSVLIRSSSAAFALCS